MRYSRTLKVNRYSSTFMEPEVHLRFHQEKKITGPCFKPGEASLCLFTLFLQYWLLCYHLSLGLSIGLLPLGFGKKLHYAFLKSCHIDVTKWAFQCRQHMTHFGWLYFTSLKTLGISFYEYLPSRPVFKPPLTVTTFTIIIMRAQLVRFLLKYVCQLFYCILV